jgi:hypothetical protein
MMYCWSLRVGFGKFRTKKEIVTQALTEFIQRRPRREILKSLGRIEFRKGWGYKNDRRYREYGRWSFCAARPS